MPRLKKQPGAGRPFLPDTIRRQNVTVKLRPNSDTAWKSFAKECSLSKGSVVEYLVASPAFAKLRREFRKTLPADPKVRKDFDF